MTKVKIPPKQNNELINRMYHCYKLSQRIGQLQTLLDKLNEALWQELNAVFDIYAQIENQKPKEKKKKPRYIDP